MLKCNNSDRICDIDVRLRIPEYISGRRVMHLFIISIVYLIEALS